MSTPATTDQSTGEPVDAVAPGFWMTVLGVVLAVLAPLGGFLGGSQVGTAPGASPSALGAWLMGGLVVGGLGVLVAVLGGLRWWRATH